MSHCGRSDYIRTRFFVSFSITSHMDNMTAPAPTAAAPLLQRRIRRRPDPIFPQQLDACRRTVFQGLSGSTPCKNLSMRSSAWSSKVTIPEQSSMGLPQSPQFTSSILRAAASAAEALASSSAANNSTVINMPSSPVVSPSLSSHDDNVAEAARAAPMDEDDSEGVHYTPLHSRVWLKNVVRLWQVFIDTSNVRQKFLKLTPEYVLSAKTFDFLKEIRRLYEVSSQPWNSDEMKYCDIMLTAVILRRAELHECKRRT